MTSKQNSLSFCSVTGALERKDDKTATDEFVW